MHVPSCTVAQELKACCSRSIRFAILKVKHGQFSSMPILTPTSILLFQLAHLWSLEKHIFSCHCLIKRVVYVPVQSTVLWASHCGSIWFQLGAFTSRHPHIKLSVKNKTKAGLARILYQIIISQIGGHTRIAYRWLVLYSSEY